ncbi:MAG: glycosyltransferase [Planctomycetota bacterium]
MTRAPRISFGMIVLNGEPFTRYCLRALYPFAHEIIVVEGACEAARHTATSDGHSTDGTLEALRRFKAEEDPEGKLRIVTRDGFWSEKAEQSRAYAELVTGDYLWQVDVDEFYMPEDMRAVIAMLEADPDVTVVSFRQIQFWGGFSYHVDGWYNRRWLFDVYRVFKWGPGYRYEKHRPPTVVTADGVDLRTVKWLDCREMSRRGVFMYHYSLVFPERVDAKYSYYARADWNFRKETAEWVESVYTKLEHPFRAHYAYELPGWLERYGGDHPPQVKALIADIEEGRLEMDLRRTDDIERLLSSVYYRFGRACLKLMEPVDRHARLWGHRVTRFLHEPLLGMGELIRRLGRAVGLRTRRRLQPSRLLPVDRATGAAVPLGYFPKAAGPPVTSKT